MRLVLLNRPVCTKDTGEYNRRVIALSQKSLILSIEPVINFRVACAGREFSDIKERGATDTGCLQATSDTEIGKIGPSPPGCGANPGPRRRVFVAGVEIGSYFVVVLALESPKSSSSASSPPPRTKTCPWGPRCLIRFSLVTQVAGKLITGSSGRCGVRALAR